MVVRNENKAKEFPIYFRPNCQTVVRQKHTRTKLKSPFYGSKFDKYACSSNQLIDVKNLVGKGAQLLPTLQLWWEFHSILCYLIPHTQSCTTNQSYQHDRLEKFRASKITNKLFNPTPAAHIRLIISVPSHCHKIHCLSAVTKGHILFSTEIWDFSLKNMVSLGNLN